MVARDAKINLLRDFILWGASAVQTNRSLMNVTLAATGSM